MREHSLLELTTTLGAGLASDAALDAALRIVMRELRVERGAFFVLGEDGRLALRASQGFAPGAPPASDIAAPRDDITAVGPGDEAHDRDGLVLLVTVVAANARSPSSAWGPAKEIGRTGPRR